MLARFQKAGGSVKWLAYTDQSVSAEFSHQQGGTVMIDWSIERAKQAGLTGKDNWNKYPRQMLRARVISEGVRTCFPAVAVGIYTPEEVQDFEPAKRQYTRKEKDMGTAQVVDEQDEALKELEQRTESAAPQVGAKIARPHVEVISATVSVACGCCAPVHQCGPGYRARRPLQGSRRWCGSLLQAGEDHAPIAAPCQSLRRRSVLVRCARQSSAAVNDLPTLTDEVSEASQNTRVLDYLLTGTPITATYAARFMGIYRLAARIYDLRRNGHRIESTTIQKGSKHFAIYRLVRE